MNDLVGGLFITMSVLFIGVGGSMGADDKGEGEGAPATEDLSSETAVFEEEKDQTLYLMISIAMALWIGLLFAFNTINLKFIINTGVDVNQANYDGCII